MSDLNTPDYYRQRERQERALAASAFNPAIGKIHLDLAARYAALLVEANDARPRPVLGIVPNR